eukprot:scaffold277546_cov21-Tisochrysis_lutea.AAC.2
MAQGCIADLLTALFQQITASGPSVREVGIQNKANTYQRAANADYANTIKAIGDRLPWSFDSSDYSVADLSAVNAWDMPGEGICVKGRPT